MNPVDLIASRHKELRKARGGIAKVQAALERERHRLTEQEAGIGAAELRDRTALADAIVSGRREPLREADALRAGLEEQTRRIDALVAALDEAQAGVAAVVRRNSSWSRDQMREVEKARARYAAAIEELERARDVFADEIGALAWLLDPEGGQGSPVNRHSAAAPARSAAASHCVGTSFSTSCALTSSRSAGGSPIGMTRSRCRGSN